MLRPSPQDISMRIKTTTETIRDLNDRLRQDLSAGIAVITPRVAALGADAVGRIIRTIAVFDDFCQENDPHGEHDFGAFHADGQTIFFKIGYYANDLAAASPDPADPTVTRRVITIMVADDY
jgi:Protein of unknown function (DUF3768)